MHLHPRVRFWENLIKDTNILLTQSLPSRSSPANWRGWHPQTWKRLICQDSFWRKCYICLEGCLNKFTGGKIDYLRAWVLLVPRPEEKRMKLPCMRLWEGCVCSPEQKMKEHARHGGEARSSVMCYMMPLNFSMLANQHAGTGAGNGRAHEELSLWEIMGRALDHLRPWNQGHLRQVWKLSPLPTRKMAVAS